MTINTFLFQEDHDVPEVNLVLLFPDKKPKIYKFKLPKSMVEDQTKTRTFYDKDLELLVVPEENQQEEPGDVQFYKELGVENKNASDKSIVEK